MTGLVWLIPIFPLAGFLINALLFRKLSRKWGGWIGCTSILLSFITALAMIFATTGRAETTVLHLFSWIATGGLNLSFAVLIDPLSILMILIITGIGFLIHVYSIGYMSEDEGSNRFFAFMNLFVFFMLLLVMASNYAVMFIGWEGVGLCSYLLIGFWFENQAYNNAAKKAFIMNRIGDLGFLLGLFLMFTTFGSLDYQNVFTQAGAMETGTPVLVAITLLLFIGATGKSAQIPLFTWLPYAMAGPTPVSALIHAATMVTAGVYMIARSNILYTLAPVSQTVVAVTGITTAIMAATVALYQNDIKKVLAWSTISQLGLMFLALGVGAYSGAMFHLTTHAFFKALLFLAAGSIIHYLHHEQDLRNMGGLKKLLPLTFGVVVIGTLAISGIPPFSGFFSKDAILLGAWENNPAYWIAAVFTSLLTAFYMFRLLFLAFYGEYRGHLIEAQRKPLARNMKFSMIVLALLAAVGGFIGLPEFTHLPNLFQEYLSTVFAASYQLQFTKTAALPVTQWILMAIVLMMILLSILLAYHRFIRKKAVPDKEPQGFIPRLLANKYYSDEAYDAAFVKPHLRLSDFLHRVVEVKILDRFVNLIGEWVVKAGNTVRYLQTGIFSFYLFIMVLSIILILFFNLLI